MTYEQLALFTPYQYCLECGWVYWTAFDLETSYMRNAPDDVHVKAQTANNIFFCPECMHDFLFSPSQVSSL